MQVDRINGLVGNQGMKTPVLCATTGAILLSGEQTIDGVVCLQPSPTNSNRVLVKNQADATTNGIYLCQALAWTREPDWDGPNDVRNGTLIPVALGATLQGTLWQVTTPDNIVIGTSALTFAVAYTSALNAALALLSGSSLVGYDSGGTVQLALDGLLGLVNIAALKALAVPTSSRVFIVQGFVTAGDGGQGIFFWNATDATADNGGTVIACTANGAANGRFNKLF